MEYELTFQHVTQQSKAICGQRPQTLEHQCLGESTLLPPSRLYVCGCVCAHTQVCACVLVRGWEGPSLETQLQISLPCGPSRLPWSWDLSRPIGFLLNVQTVGTKYICVCFNQGPVQETEAARGF